MLLQDILEITLHWASKLLHICFLLENGKRKFHFLKKIVAYFWVAYACSLEKVSLLGELTMVDI